MSDQQARRENWEKTRHKQMFESRVRLSLNSGKQPLMEQITLVQAFMHGHLEAFKRVLLNGVDPNGFFMTEDQSICRIGLLPLRPFKGCFFRTKGFIAPILPQFLEAMLDAGLRMDVPLAPEGVQVAGFKGDTIKDRYFGTLYPHILRPEEPDSNLKGRQYHYARQLQYHEMAMSIVTILESREIMTFPRPEPRKKKRGWTYAEEEEEESDAAERSLLGEVARIRQRVILSSDSEEE